MGDLPGSLILSRFQESDRPRAFVLYESTLRPTIEAAFGWDDVFQLNRFAEKYPTSWFHWLHHCGSEVGFVSYFETDNELHLSLLVLKPEFQKQGLGFQAMQHIHQLAQNRRVSLSSFKNNTGAIRFYQKLGYTQTGADDYFCDFTYGK